MQIVEKKEYPLLSRTEIIAKESYTGATPSRDTIRRILAEKLNAKNELIVIKHIYPEFGSGNAKIIAYLYSNKKDMEIVEPEYAFNKGLPKEKKEELKAEQEKEKPVEQEKQDKGKPEEKKPKQDKEERKEELSEQKKPKQNEETKEIEKEETKAEQKQQENKDTKE